MMLVEPKWTTPKIHTPSDPPFCKQCEAAYTTFFNLQCQQCYDILISPETNISHIFAILRQWISQIQLSIDLMVREILKRGGNVNDKDGLTDMTLLHYACKAGSSGVGDVKTALRTVHFLVSKGADINVRCRWTDMAAIHYAVYFDVSEIVDFLLTISERKCIDEICRDFDGGTPLHIAAANLCIDSVKVLLKHSANVLLKDDQGRTALDCIPDDQTLMNSAILSKQSAFQVAAELRTILEAATLATIPGENYVPIQPVTGKVVLQALGLTLGDKVIINGTKIGWLRFCGATQFASGIWAGVELEEPDAKHDGTYQGVTYFKCPPNHGIFSPISRICKYDTFIFRPAKVFGTPNRVVNHPGVDISHVTPKVETGLSSLKNRSIEDVVEVGDVVLLNDKRKGTVRFVGETEFAPGIWYGIEFDKPIGKNDGSVGDVRYFECNINCGLFSNRYQICKVIRNRHSTDDEGSESSFTFSGSSSERAKSPTNLKKPSSSRNSLKISPQTQGPLSLMAANSNSNSSLSWLTLGVNVFVNNEIATVRYIGPVDFADGTWLGVELRSNNGKNDGSVQGKRYFICKNGRGLFVRPKKISIRGINGAKLLEETEGK